MTDTEFNYNTYHLLWGSDDVYATILNDDGSLKDEILNVSEVVEDYAVMFKPSSKTTEFTKFKSSLEEETIHLEPVEKPKNISTKQFISAITKKTNNELINTELLGATYKDNFVFNNYMKHNSLHSKVSNSLVASFDIETNVYPEYDKQAQLLYGDSDTVGAFPSYQNSLYEINLMTISFMQTKNKQTDINVFVNNSKSKKSELEIYNYLYSKVPDYTTLPITDINIFMCENEQEMLINFFKVLKQRRPAILTGWNIDNFDIPYVYSRLLKYYTDKQAQTFWNLSKSGNYELVSFYEKDNNYTNEKQLIMNNSTVCVIDYLSLYRKFELSPRTSYSLDNISIVELNATKLKYSGSFYNFYSTKYDEEFTLYNVIDTLRVLEIDVVKSFINILYSVAYYANANLKDGFFNTRIWDMIMSNRLYERGIIPIHKKEVTNSNGYIGAYVKDVITPNAHIDKNQKARPYTFASFDATSLYPSLIIQNNISPETKSNDKQFFHRFTRENDLLDITDKPSNLMSSAQKYAKENNKSITANGLLFDRTKQGIMPELLEELLILRKKTKRTMKELEQELYKRKHTQPHFAH